MKLVFNLKELINEIESLKKSLCWQDNLESGNEFLNHNNGKYHNGKHGTQWCNFKPSKNLIDNIEASIGCPVYKEVFYLWDYGKQKALPIHIDTMEINSGRLISCCIPITGRFKIKMYKMIDKSKVEDECIYGPGEVILLNNLKYYHEGFVLDESRLGLHFFLDISENASNKELKELLLENKLKR